MKPVRLITLVTLAALLMTSGAIVVAHAAQPSIPQRVAALKATLAANQARLKTYEWIQTTVVSLKGEEKSRKQERCYYGADGALQKIEVGASSAPAKKRGLRGRIAAKKTAELTDYMKKAVSLVKSYVPPDPAKIQAALNAGKVTIEVLEPGKRARLNFPDYLKAGDNLGVEVDLVGNRPLNVTVSTYLDNGKDAVMLDARMGQLKDGTVYAPNITLNAQARDLKVTVQNSGYRKMMRTGGS